MPTPTTELPDTLRPYSFHGIEFGKIGKNVYGECIFCGRENKFSVLVENGVYRCVACNETGNARTFVKKLWELSNTATKDRSEISQHRGFLSGTGLTHWEVVKSITTKDWLVPGYNVDGKLTTLYRYIKSPERWKLLPTPTLGHALHGVCDKSKPIVWICEGPWDGVSLWEVLSQCKSTDTGFAQTANPKASLLADSCVLAVPGCSVFNEAWLPLFAGKIVNLMYDSDHPKPNPKTGVLVEPAGYAGMLRVAKMLASESLAPKEINLLRWGPNGFDPDLPSGHDIRDSLKGTLPERINALEKLVERLEIYGQQTTSDGQPIKVSDGGLACKPCESFAELIKTWRKAMKWTDGLEHGLSCMLASITSTKSLGDQLWFRVISPASSGKSVLCEAISIAKEYVLAKSTLRGFHSGYDDGSGDNHSPLAAMLNKTLVIKDGDTLLQAPNLPQILSEARDIYDRVSRSSYRTKQSKDWSGINLTIVLCGTNSLRTLDQSELGERFLTCQMMEGIDDDLEDDILWRVINKADRNLAVEADGKPESQQDAEMTEAMQLTGGYVCYLRQNAQDLLSQVDSSDEARRYVTRLGKFVAYMRARPSVRQDEIAEREFAARLVSQHWRVAKCLAVVYNKREVDSQVMAQTKRVAMDTARGLTLDIVRHLHSCGEDGSEKRAVAVQTARTDDQTGAMLRFLRKIEVVEPFEVKRTGMSKAPRWRLAPKIDKLYREVVGGGE